MSNKIAEINNTLTKLEGFKSKEEMEKWANAAIDSGYLPSSITEPEQVMVIVQHGKELGITPHLAIQNIHVISGRPTLSSSMLGSLLKTRRVEWTWDEDFALIKDSDGNIEKLGNGTSNRRTTIHFYWKSKITERVMETTFSVTWAQMALAGYTTKQNWEKYPKEMLRARCLAYAIRALFPEVLSGIYTDLEIEDVTGEGNVIEVTEEGDIILTNKDN